MLSVLAAASMLWASADEGMWLPSLIGMRQADMRAKGFRLTAEDIYSVNHASLKDAVVLFGGGCTGEVVSPEGLLFTNHHCGYGAIQKHSSVENDYLTDGFWAMDRSEELPNPGLEVRFLVRMEDVTDRVLSGTDARMSDSVRSALISENMKSIKEQASGDGRYSASVESLYYGNQYFLYVEEVFRDVRLVAAPPSGIGKFGGDTDNWMWPRHTGDFSVFRIYADKDNRPADYSPDNVPYRPKKYLPVSVKGVDEGDFTFVYGFPGTTRQYVTSDYVDYTLNYSNPHKIRLRTERLDIIKAAQEADPAVRIMYAAKCANIANAWKKWQGESLGLRRLGTVERKRAYEERFSDWAEGREEYAGVLPALHKAYDSLAPYAFARDYYNEAVFAVELLRPAMGVVSGVGDSAYYHAFYKDYSARIDRDVSKAMFRSLLEHVGGEFLPEGFAGEVEAAGGTDGYADALFDASALTTLEGYERLAADSAALASDPAVALARRFMDFYKRSISPAYVSLNSGIDRLYNTYMRGQMEFEPDKPFYPDANLTLRIAYGHVDGYRAADAVRHTHLSTLEGIMQKDDPDVYDYDIPQRLRDAYRTKDYGRYAVNVGTKRDPYYTVPVAFIATNHTTGGNSGSPVLDGRGRLVGLNFDRTWLSTMSDLEFDPQVCRNIAVDIRYVLFVIEKVGGASWLLDEMDIAG